MSSRIVTSFILCLFVNFVLSNSVFMHTHVGADGHRITHSHPYMPSGQHSHQAAQFDQIAGFNAAAAAFDVPAAPAAVPYRTATVCTAGLTVLHEATAGVASCALRGPPACGNLS